MSGNGKPPLALFQQLGAQITTLTPETAPRWIAADFVLSEVEGHPYGGPCSGPAAFAGRMARIRRLEHACSFQMDCLVADDSANVLFHGRLRVTTPDGATHELPLMERWRFEGDKLAELAMFWQDPAKAIAVLSAVEPR
jgi:hypothetical protein